MCYDFLDSCHLAPDLFSVTGLRVVFESSECGPKRRAVRDPAHTGVDHARSRVPPQLEPAREYSVATGDDHLARGHRGTYDASMERSLACKQFGRRDDDGKFYDGTNAEPGDNGGADAACARDAAAGADVSPGTEDTADDETFFECDDGTSGEDEAAVGSTRRHVAQVDDTRRRVAQVPHPSMPAPHDGEPRGPEPVSGLRQVSGLQGNHAAMEGASAHCRGEGAVAEGAPVSASPSPRTTGGLAMGDRPAVVLAAASTGSSSSPGALRQGASCGAGGARAPPGGAGGRRRRLRPRRSSETPRHPSGCRRETTFGPLASTWLRQSGRGRKALVRRTAASRRFREARCR